MAAALTAAGADVHGAVVEVDRDGGATARFELTDRRGQKLDEGTRAAVVAALVTGRRRGVLLRRRRPVPQPAWRATSAAPASAASRSR